jgi:hypothetical protein
MLLNMFLGVLMFPKKYGFPRIFSRLLIRSYYVVYTASRDVYMGHVEESKRSGHAVAGPGIGQD